MAARPFPWPSGGDEPVVLKEKPEIDAARRRVRL